MATLAPAPPPKVFQAISILRQLKHPIETKDAENKNTSTVGNTTNSDYESINKASRFVEVNIKLNISRSLVDRKKYLVKEYWFFVQLLPPHLFRRFLRRIFPDVTDADSTNELFHFMTLINSYKYVPAELKNAQPLHDAVGNFVDSVRENHGLRYQHDARANNLAAC